MEIEQSVINKIIQRRDIGRAKYGTTMERQDLSTLDWLNHAQQEAMDLAIYLEKLIQLQSSHAKNPQPQPQPPPKVHPVQPTMPETPPTGINTPPLPILPGTSQVPTVEAEEAK